MTQENELKIKLLVLYDILCRMTDEDHALILINSLRNWQSAELRSTEGLSHQTSNSLTSSAMRFYRTKRNTYTTMLSVVRLTPLKL